MININLCNFIWIKKQYKRPSVVKMSVSYLHFYFINFLVKVDTENHSMLFLKFKKKWINKLEKVILCRLWVHFYYTYYYSTCFYKFKKKHFFFPLLQVESLQADNDISKEQLTAIKSKFFFSDFHSILIFVYISN